MLRYIVYDVARLGEAGKIEPHTDNQSQAPSRFLGEFGWSWQTSIEATAPHTPWFSRFTAVGLQLAATGDRCDPPVSWAWLQRWRQSFWAWLRWRSNLAQGNSEILNSCILWVDISVLPCIQGSKSFQRPKPLTNRTFIVWLGWTAQTHNMITEYRWLSHHQWSL